MAALFGLIGVVLGALITSGFEWLRLRREERHTRRDRLEVALVELGDVINELLYWVIRADPNDDTVSEEGFDAALAEVTRADMSAEAALHRFVLASPAVWEASLAVKEAVDDATIGTYNEETGPARPIHEAMRALNLAARQDLGIDPKPNPT